MRRALGLGGAPDCNAQLAAQPGAEQPVWFSLDALAAAPGCKEAGQGTADPSLEPPSPGLRRGRNPAIRDLAAPSHLPAPTSIPSPLPSASTPIEPPAGNTKFRNEAAALLLDDPRFDPHTSKGSADFRRRRRTRRRLVEHVLRSHFAPIARLAWMAQVSTRPNPDGPSPEPKY
jgi:hypothetical protein